MCHNKETSAVISLFALAVIVSLFIKYRDTGETKYAYAAAYIFVLALMQVTEFFIHWYKNNPKSMVYQLASVFILVTFIIQFIASEVCIYMNGAPKEMCILDIVFYLVMAYSMYSIKDSFGSFVNENNCSNPLIGCKLIWDVCVQIYENAPKITTLAVLIYMVYVGWTSYLIFDWPVLLIYLGTLVFTFGTSYFVGGKNKGKSIAYGSSSAWCLWAIGLSLLLIIMDDKVLANSHV